jgi:hypothetical protein
MNIDTTYWLTNTNPPFSRSIVVQTMSTLKITDYKGKGILDSKLQDQIVKSLNIWNYSTQLTLFISSSVSQIPTK